MNERVRQARSADALSNDLEVGARAVAGRQGIIVEDKVETGVAPKGNAVKLRAKIISSDAVFIDVLFEECEQLVAAVTRSIQFVVRVGVVEERVVVHRRAQ